MLAKDELRLQPGGQRALSAAGMGKEGGAHCKITCSVKAKQPPLEHNLLSGVMFMKCDRRSEGRKGQVALPFKKRSVIMGF